MGAASRRKGREGEGELRKLWVAAGWDCVAAQRNLGGGGGDIRANKPGVALHVECKRTERVQVPKWIEQASSEAPAGTRPVVVFRQSRARWYAVLALDDLLELIP